MQSNKNQYNMVIAISKNCLLPILISPYFPLKSGVKGDFGIGFRKSENLIPLLKTDQIKRMVVILTNFLFNNTCVNTEY